MRILYMKPALHFACCFSLGLGTAMPVYGQGADPKPASRGLAGFWQASMKAGGNVVHLNFAFVKNKTGALSGTMYNPSAGNTSLDFDTVSVEDGIIRLSHKAKMFEITGKLNDDHTEIQGT